MAGPNNGRYARPYNSPHVDEVEVRVPIGANGANSAPLSGYGVLSWTEVSQGTYDVALEQPRGGIRGFSASCIQANASVNAWAIVANDLPSGGSTLRVYVKNAATGALTRPASGDVILLAASFNEQGW